NLAFTIFFFQAEDGIRDRNVTGVQTCALPIFDVAVGVLRRVVELAQGRVTGAGVVPRIRALLGDIVELLVDTDVPIGLEFGQHGAESGAHDAAAAPGDDNLLLL